MMPTMRELKKGRPFYKEKGKAIIAIRAVGKRKRERIKERKMRGLS